ncbi:Chromatin modification- protein meaf6 [Coemansia sp. Benny D115]|nr:Chromatin modification- protein meaf6 [Coemansia sp. Benny D115]
MSNLPGTEPVDLSVGGGSSDGDDGEDSSVGTPESKPAAAAAAAAAATATTDSTPATKATTPAPAGSGSTPKPAKANGKLPGEGKLTKKMLKEAEQELFQLLVKKKQIDRSLIDTESAIYDFETSYFENSNQDGNIVHGFEGYLASGRQHEHRRQHFSEADRIFSQSSATFKKAQEARIAASLLDSDSDESEGSAVKAKARKAGGSTIKHSSQRQGTPNGGRSTPTPGAGAPKQPKKLRLSIDSGSLGN